MSINIYRGFSPKVADNESGSDSFDNKFTLIPDTAHTMRVTPKCRYQRRKRVFEPPGLRFSPRQTLENKWSAFIRGRSASPETAAQLRRVFSPLPSSRSKLAELLAIAHAWDTFASEPSRRTLEVVHDTEIVGLVPKDPMFGLSGPNHLRFELADGHVGEFIGSSDGFGQWKLTHQIEAKSDYRVRRGVTQILNRNDYFYSGDPLIYHRGYQRFYEPVTSGMKNVLFYPERPEGEPIGKIPDSIEGISLGVTSEQLVRWASEFKGRTLTKKPTPEVDYLPLLLREGHRWYLKLFGSVHNQYLRQSLIWIWSSAIFRLGYRVYLQGLTLQEYPEKRRFYSQTAQYVFRLFSTGLRLGTLVDQWQDELGELTGPARYFQATQWFRNRLGLPPEIAGSFDAWEFEKKGVELPMLQDERGMRHYCKRFVLTWFQDIPTLKKHADPTRRTFHA